MININKTNNNSKKTISSHIHFFIKQLKVQFVLVDNIIIIIIII